MKKIVGSLLFLVLISGCQTAPQGFKRSGEVPKFVQLEQVLNEAESAYRLGKYDKAEELFSKAIEIQPNSEQANYRLGSLNFKKKNLKKSAQYFSKVVLVNPKNAKAHYNLGTIHLMFAEEHMRFFAATAPRDFDISKVSTLLGDLNKFSSRDDQKKAKKFSSVSTGTDKLDKLVNLIEKN